MGAAGVDPIDLDILQVLLEDGRIAISDLAGRVNVSRANAYARLQRLTEAGVLRGFSAQVDSAKLGLGIHAMVLVSLETRRDLGSISDSLRSMPEVEFAGISTGQFDVLLLARLSDVDGLRRFAVDRLGDIPDVRSTITALILEEAVTRRTVLPDLQ